MQCNQPGGNSLRGKGRNLLQSSIMTIASLHMSNVGLKDIFFHLNFGETSSPKCNHFYLLISHIAQSFSISMYCINYLHVGLEPTTSCYVLTYFTLFLFISDCGPTLVNPDRKKRGPAEYTYKADNVARTD